MRSLRWKSPYKDLSLEGSSVFRLKYLTLPLTISIPQTFSVMSPWEWSLAGLLMNRSVPHLPTLMGGGDLSKAGSTVMTMAGHPTWIPARNISRYLLSSQRVCSVCVCTGGQGGQLLCWSEQRIQRLETQHTWDHHSSIHPNKYMCQAQIGCARHCGKCWGKMTSETDTAPVLVKITRPWRSCLARVLFALSLWISKEHSMNRSRCSSFLAQGGIRDLIGGRRGGIVL